MKLFILLSLFILCSQRLFAQKIKYLDQNKSLREFKIGDDFSKWESESFYEKGEGDGKIYKFTGTAGFLFDSFKINLIRLSFLKTKLVKIDIDLEEWPAPASVDSISYLCDKKLKEVSKKFADLYGTSNSSSPVEGDDNSYRQGTEHWYTKNVYLTVGVFFMLKKGHVYISMEEQDYRYKRLMNNMKK